MFFRRDLLHFAVKLSVVRHHGDLVDHEILDFHGGERGMWTRVEAVLLGSGTNVVVVFFAVAPRVGVEHRGSAMGTLQLRSENAAAGAARARLAASGVAVAAQQLPNPFEDFGGDDGLVFAVIFPAIEIELAGVGFVGQESVQRRGRELRAAGHLAVAVLPAFVPPAVGADGADGFQHRAPFKIDAENLPHQLRFLRVDRDRPAAGNGVVAEDRAASGEFAQFSLHRHFVAGAFGDDFSLELRERQENVQRQPPHAVGRVEMLRHADEGGLVFVEDFDDPRKIQQRPGEAVDLVDHDDVDLAFFHIFEQFLQRRTLQIAAGETAVVVTLRQADPALVLLAGNVVLRRHALRVERVEILFQALVGAFARVDRAPFLFVHIATLKNALPLMWLPVIFLATAESER